MEPPTSLPVKLLPSNVRPIAYRILSKKYGLNIKTDSLRILTDFISQKFGFDWKGPQAQKFIEEIGKAWKVQERGNFIDGEGILQVIKELTVKKEIASINNISGTTDSAKENGNGIVQITNDVELDWNDYFRIITPSEQPHFKFDKNHKQFTLVPEGHTKHISAFLQSSLDYYTERYYQLSERLARNEVFQRSVTPKISSTTTSMSDISQTYKITQIKNLLGRDGMRFILFGLLTTNENGDYVLEDSTDRIVLNLSQAYKNEGSYYCTGMFLVAEGIYSATGGVISQANILGGCFHVSNLGHPPAEKRELSLESYGDLDFMGVYKEQASNGNPVNIVRISKEMKRKVNLLEKSLQHKMYFLGSDCFLDDARCIEGLKKFFTKIESSLIENEAHVPLAIVLVGSFALQPVTSNTSSASISSSENYKANFDLLADVLAKFPNIVKTVKFVIIPGKNDPWQSTYSLGCSVSNVRPQRPMPRMFLTRLERLLPKKNLILGWNPTRINYMSQEIVLFTDAFNSTFKRNDIIFDTDLESRKQEILTESRSDGHIHASEVDTTHNHLPQKTLQARQIVKTLLDQGTLQSFSNDIRTIDPRYSFCLRIDPLPSVLVLFDPTFPNFEVTYNGTRVVNVGKLLCPSRQFSYMEYTAATKSFDHRIIYV